MRLVLIDRRRESLHVGLSLCEGRARTDRGIHRNDDYDQDEKKDESSKCPDEHSQQPRFLSRRCRGGNYGRHPVSHRLGSRYFTGSISFTLTVVEPRVKGSR